MDRQSKSIIDCLRARKATADAEHTPYHYKFVTLSGAISVQFRDEFLFWAAVENRSDLMGSEAMPDRCAGSSRLSQDRVGFPVPRPVLSDNSKIAAN
jgi:hypothetical protein